MSDENSTPAGDPLRILHVSEVTWGGVVTLLQHFITEQHRDGHDVHVLAPLQMPRLNDATQHSWRVSRSRPWSVVTAWIDLVRTVRSVSPDVVHLHSFVAGFLARVPGVRGRLGRETTLIYQPHAWAFDLYSSRVFRLLVKRWEAWGGTRTDVLVANCDDEVQEGRAAGVRTPAEVLGVAVDMHRFSPISQQERATVRRRLGLSNQSAALCLGRLAGQKGQDLLVPAWERAAPQAAELYLVGPGDQEPLRELAPTTWGRSIHAIGERHDVEDWLRACDVLVLPSRYETVALVVAEALACGTPVVATAVNGARETITAGPMAAAGAVVALNDMTSLLNELALRLFDPARRGAESSAARRRAQALFDPRAVAARLEAAYTNASRLHKAPEETA